MLRRVDDQPIIANPATLAISVYSPAIKNTMIPMMPKYRHNRIGNFENENIASELRDNNLK
jgi:hypothetical protein